MYTPDATYNSQTGFPNRLIVLNVGLSFNASPISAAPSSPCLIENKNRMTSKDDDDNDLLEYIIYLAR